MTNWKPYIEGGSGPKYQSLADAIQRDVFSGRLKPGERLPTHRELADAIGVNVSTITRGYVEAERRGLISGTVGRGTFVAADAQAATFMVSFEPHVPGLIEMGLIEPLYAFEPPIQDGLRKLMRRRNVDSFMRYSDPRGLPEHRAVGADWVGLYGLKVEPQDVVVCSGAQHGITCCLSALFCAGDRIGVDSLTYPAMKTLANMLGIRLVALPMDEQGVTPEGLDVACRRGALKGVYLMPGLQNPTTSTMSQQRREEIAQVVQKHSLVLIEDDAYDLTVHNDTPPISAMVPEQSVYIAGLSKALAAGLRVAFMAAPKELRRPLSQAVLNSVWMTPPINAELACQWIMDGTALWTLERKREEARVRNAITREILGGYEYRGHDTGFFIWLALPEPWRGSAFEAKARAAGVNVFGAEKFAVGESNPPAMARIALSGPETQEDLRQGLGILRNVLEHPEEGLDM
ncbi:MAG: PLP-dependent aminotransferase family protein [Desulfovibrio sp.]|uniref:aminotransferase-like domain-containing protein n=1 Tax=Desulfovibrio sp. 7SRBS1 TaxID=3378064 RepID=UPI003B403CC6